MITPEAAHERQLWPGGLADLGSDADNLLSIEDLDPAADNLLSIEDLDPADHAAISAIDPFRVVFTFGSFGLSFCDGSERPASVLDTRTPGASLAIGPLRFEASAPGQVTVRAPPGVSLRVKAPTTAP